MCKVATPARDQLNVMENVFFAAPRDTGSIVLSRVILLILHTQTESGAYS